MTHRMILTSLLSCLFILVGCSSQQASKEINGQPTPSAEQSENNEDKVDNPDAPSDDTTTPEEKEEPNDEANTPLPDTIEITLAGELELETHTAHLQQSELGYFLYTLEGYRLEQEEQGKDILIAPFNEEIFMRIQPLGNNVSAEEKKASITEKAEGNLTEAESIDESNTAYTLIEEIPSDTGTLTLLHVGKEVDNQLFAFTIHIPVIEAIEAAEPAFLAMMETVETQK